MKKILSILFIGMLLINTGCQKYVLDKTPTDRFTQDNVWSDPVLIESYLLAQYRCTPVMINDATTVINDMDWQGPLGLDDVLGQGWGYTMSHSANIWGAGLNMDLTDETKYTDGAWQTYRVEKSTGISSLGGVLEYFANAYYTIRNLNDYISRVPDSPLDKSLKSQRLAEARFLRAYNYFAMVKRYGGVPLITKVQNLNDPEEVLFPVRNKEKEIYDFVIAEMDSIAPALAQPTDYGRANNWAALSLQCRAALYAGSIAQFGVVQLNGLLGIPNSAANNYYQKAYDAANKIIQSGVYQLYNNDADKVQNFKNIFLVKRNSEAIMAKQHSLPDFLSGGTNTWSWDMMETPRPHVWGGGNEHAPYLEMVEEFERIDGSPGTIDRAAIQQGTWTMKELWKDRDPRFYASIWTNGEPWKNAVAGAFGRDTVNFYAGLIKPDGSIISDINISYSGIPSIGDQASQFTQLGDVYTSFGIMKYLNPDQNNMIFSMESTTDYLIFRYAETLLNFAEAAFELGKTGDAMAAINQIRQRAGMPLITSIDREKIHHERKVELAFENHRYWDLRRWRQADTKLTRSFSGIRYLYDFQSAKFKVEVVNDIDGTTTPPTFQLRNYYLPITQTRIGNNKNLIENPGY